MTLQAHVGSRMGECLEGQQLRGVVGPLCRACDYLREALREPFQPPIPPAMLRRSFRCASSPAGRCEPAWLPLDDVRVTVRGRFLLSADIPRLFGIRPRGPWIACSAVENPCVSGVYA